MNLKRTLSIALTVCMLLALLPVSALALTDPAQPATISYMAVIRDANSNTQQCDLTLTDTDTYPTTITFSEGNLTVPAAPSFANGGLTGSNLDFGVYNDNNISFQFWYLEGSDFIEPEDAPNKYQPGDQVKFDEVPANYNYVCLKAYYKVVTPAAEEYVVTFNPAEGQADAEAFTVAFTADTTYTLAEPSWTAPEGMVFKGWQNNDLGVIWTSTDELTFQYVKDNNITSFTAVYTNTTTDGDEGGQGGSEQAPSTGSVGTKVDVPGTIDEETGAVNFGDTTSIPVYAILQNVDQDDSIKYSVEIVYGDMQFAWGFSEESGGVWNPETHQYETTEGDGSTQTAYKTWYLVNDAVLTAGGAASYDMELNNSHVLLVNHSNAPVQATLEITDNADINVVKAHMLSQAGALDAESSVLSDSGFGGYYSKAVYLLARGTEDKPYDPTVDAHAIVEVFLYGDMTYTTEDGDQTVTGLGEDFTIAAENTGLREDTLTTVATLTIVLEKPADAAEEVAP